MKVYGDLERSFDLGIGGPLADTTPVYFNNVIFLFQVFNFTPSLEHTAY